MFIVITKDNCCINIMNHQVHKQTYSVTGQSFHCILNFVRSCVTHLSACALTETQRPVDTAGALQQSQIQEKGFLKIIIKPL